MPLSAYLIVSAILFTVGVVGVLIRRNPLIIFMSIELMLNAVNLSFVDGHQETHRWLVGDTARPARQGAARGTFPAVPITDFEWLKNRTSVKKPNL